MALNTTTQAILDAVTAEKTQTASAIVLLQQLNSLVQNVQSPEDLVALKQAVADLTGNTAAITAAVQANTPAA